MAESMFPGYTREPIASAPSRICVLVTRETTYANAWRGWRGRWWSGQPRTGTRIPLDFEPTHWLRPDIDRTAR